MAEQTLKEKTSKGLFWGGMSNLLPQILGAVFGIYLARTLSPDDYGLVGMLTIFNIIATTLQDGGFSTTLINQKEIKKEEYDSVFWWNIGIAWACYLILFFSAPVIARFFRHPELVLIARCCFLSFVLTGFGTTQKAYLSKNLRIKEIGIVNIFSSLFSGLLGVFMAWRGYGYWALVIQTLSYGLFSNAGYWLFSDWRPSMKVNFEPALKLLRYSVKLLITNLAVTINSNFINVILGRFYPVNKVGYYTQANKWSFIGYSVLSGMINSVAQPVLVEVVDDDERQLRVLRKMMRFAAFICFPCMLGLAFISPEFVNILLTDKWNESVLLMQILCVGFAVNPISNILLGLVLSRCKYDTYMWTNILVTAIAPIAALFLYPYGIVPMVVSITVMNIVSLFVWRYLSYREIRYSFRNLLADLTPFFAITLISLALAWLCTSWIEGIVWRLILKIVVALITYVSIMIITSSATFKECISYITKRIMK